MVNKITHITSSDGNVFADLGFSPEQAEQLKANSQFVVSVKLQLMQSLSEWIQENHLKQVQVAQILDISRPRVSDVVNQKISKFTIDSLMTMLTKTNRKVELLIKI